MKAFVKKEEPSSCSCKDPDPKPLTDDERFIGTEDTPPSYTAPN